MAFVALHKEGEQVKRMSRNYTKGLQFLLESNEKLLIYYLCCHYFLSIRY